MLGVLVGLALGAIIARYDVLTLKRETDPLAVLALAVNIGMVFVVQHFLRRHQTRESYSVDALSTDVRELIEHVSRLHSTMINSSAAGMTHADCVDWLAKQRESMNRLRFIESESEAWGGSSAARKCLKTATDSWLKYKEITTSHRFPVVDPGRFRLGPEQQADAEREHKAFKAAIGAYRRALVV